MSMKPPKAPPGDQGPPGSSRASILQWVRNKNNQADLYLKKVLDFHQRELVFNIIRLEEEKLDWHYFLKKLKECNSDDLSEFAGLVADRLKAAEEEQEEQGKIRKKKRTRFRDLFTEEELTAAPPGGADVRRSSTMPELFTGNRRESHASLMERFHSDTQVYQRPIYTVAEETEGESRPHTRTRQQITTPGMVTSLRQDEHEISEDQRKSSALHLPNISESHEGVRDRLSGKPEALKNSKLAVLKCQSLPNISPSAANFSLTASGYQDHNHGNQTHIHSNQTDNSVGDASVVVPDINVKKRKRKCKRQVSLVNRIDEFYKKLDDFEKRHEQPSDYDSILPALQP